jgi:hypothetical protein
VVISILFDSRTAQTLEPRMYEDNARMISTAEVLPLAASRMQRLGTANPRPCIREAASGGKKYQQSEIV